MPISLEIKKCFRPIFKENKPWWILKKPLLRKEEKKSWSFRLTTSSLQMTKRPLKELLMLKLPKRLKDNIKWEMPNGREKIKQGSTFWKMFTNQERRIFCWNNRIKEKQIGISNMRNSKWRLLLLSKMQSMKQEQLRRLSLERPTSLISWSKWMKRIEFRGNIFKRKCMKRELPD